MKGSRYGTLSFLALLTVTAALAADPPPESKDRAPDTWLLVQSELDHLPAADRPITLDAKGLSPSAVLEEIGKKSGLTIQVRGSLPPGVELSPSFRDTAAGTVLKWFAEQVPVQFRARPPSTLEIFVEPPKVAPKREAGE